MVLCLPNSAPTVHTHPATPILHQSNRPNQVRTYYLHVGAKRVDPEHSILIQRKLYQHLSASFWSYGMPPGLNQDLSLEIWIHICQQDLPKRLQKCRPATQFSHICLIQFPKIRDAQSRVPHLFWFIMSYLVRWNRIEWNNFSNFFSILTFDLWKKIWK